MKSAFAPAVFVIFVLAGYVKADPRLAWIPFDLTALTAAVVVLLAAGSLIQRNWRIPTSAAWVVALWFTFALPIMFLAVPLDTAKIGRLFSITLLAASAPFFLVRSREQSVRYLYAFGAAGAILAADALVRFALGTSGVLRMSTGGGDVIALGRGTGLAILWFAWLTLQKRVPAAVGVGALSILLLILLATGQRGPAIFAVVSLLPMASMIPLRRRIRFAALIAVCAAIGSQFLAYLPTFAIARLTRLSTGMGDSSVSSRFEAISRSWAYIPSEPLGIGWGGFTREIALWGSDVRQYPHNIIVEIGLEAGWLATVLFIVFVGFAYFRSRRHAAAPLAIGMWAFVTLNAMVSGDINDNRILFAIFAIIIAGTGWRRSRAEPVISADPLPSAIPRATALPLART